VQYLTYKDIKRRVLKPTDTQDELFIETDELLDLCHDAIKACEAKIHTLYEDYFLKRGYLALTTGEELYSLPTDIYASKIRRIIYRKTGEVYTISRIIDWKKFEEIEYEREHQQDSSYRYFLINQGASTKVQLNLIPASKETSSTNVVIYYLRSASLPTLDTDLIDIPEFYDYITCHMRAHIYKKEGHPNTQDEFSLLSAKGQEMEATLATMVPDDRNEVPIDTTFYEESY
jgi:hypothetical protein